MFEDKSTFVEKVFSSVASKYDLMNDLMSLGLHRIWKNKLIKEIYYSPAPKCAVAQELAENISIIDVACGTGDIAYKILNKIPTADVTLCDRNIEMLNEGKNRFINNNVLNANFICADAENLPFKDNSFDYYTIVFGIRNVTNITKALSEAYRVLKDGGKFLCLEFGHVKNKYLSEIYDLYSFKIIPFVGKRVTGDKEAYEYLVNSIRQFPFKEEFIIMMNDVMFTQIRCTDLSNGIVNMYSGIKQR